MSTLVADRLAETLPSPEAWDPTPQKFKTPYEFLVSLGARPAPAD